MVEAFRPEKMSDLLEIRRRYNALPFAGGTDLMVKHRRPTGALPEIERPVVFLDRCAELKEIIHDTTGIKIGAAVTYTELISHPLIPTVLTDICGQIAAPGLRNIATIGGNICNASPAGDTLPYLYAFDATVELRSVRGARMAAIGDFITGPGTIDLEQDEILVAVHIPAWDPALWRYRKVGTRKANALTKVSFAGFADTDGEMVTSAAVAFGAVGPTVVRPKLLEKELTGVRITQIPEYLPRLLDVCGESVSPIDDQRSSAAYRRRVAVNLFRAFLVRDLGGEN